MAIPQSQYVAINSVVGGASQVPGREFIARLFTDNPIMPPQSYAEFPNADAVGAYFGYLSQEYLRAAIYFAYFSKTGTAPTNISFGRWVDEAVAPMVFGYIGAIPQAWATYHGITNGAIGLNINGTFVNFTGIDFSATANLNDVAAALQTAIRVSFASATVIYSAATANFVLSSGVTGAGSIIVAAGTGGTDLSGLLNWLPQTTITNGEFNYSSSRATTTPGSAVETPVQAVTTSAGLSNNFGSFAFMPKQLSLTLTASSATVPVSDTSALSVGMSVEGVGIPAGTVIYTISANTNVVLGQVGAPATPVPVTVSGVEVISFYLSLPQAVSVAMWNKSQNVDYMYQLSVNSGNASIWQAGLVGIAGTGINLESGVPGEYIEMFPMAIQAATDYAYANSVVGYEFQQQAGYTASVSDLNTALAYNAQSINYFGVTQTAGQLITFYQQGVLQGGATDPTDMNTYANEIWLKDALGAVLLNLLLSVAQVPANNGGRTMLFAVMQGVINQALLNGTISVGKNLTPTQIVYIGEITNDPNAWYQVQNQGYWRDVVFIAQNTTPVTYAAVYTLVYSKDDVIRKVIGTDVLI